MRSPSLRGVWFGASAAACLLVSGSGQVGAASTEADAEAAASKHSVSYFSFFDGWGSDAGDAYALDATPRHLEPRERVRCDTASMQRYHSRALRYGVIVHPAFAPRLERFEALLVEHAKAAYGRAPRRLVHRGAFACRSTRANRERVSEHAFGNALDFQGLDFGPLPRGAAAPSNMPRALRQGFSLRVRTHWFPRRERDAYHAAFLHQLAEALRARPDIFRGIVGPPRPRHADHLHFDAAPWRYAMFAYDAS